MLVGETAPVGKPGTTIGPAEFMRRWLCLDEDFDRAPVDRSCASFTRLDVDGFAHHPVRAHAAGPGEEGHRQPAGDPPARAATSTAPRAPGACPCDLPIYNTEFGLQSNPPDPTVSTTLARQAALINEKEELSYRYPRLRSYSQYLMYDDPPRPTGRTSGRSGPGFQTGLRFTDGRRKPAWDAFRLPIVVHTRGPGRVLIWGRVRPGEGTRTVRLELRRRRRVGARPRELETDDAGYFEVRRAGARALPLSRVRRRPRARDEPRRDADRLTPADIAVLRHGGPCGPETSRSERV